MSIISTTRTTVRVVIWLLVVAVLGNIAAWLYGYIF